MSTKYTHLEVGKDVSARSGYYTPQKEVLLKDNGRDVLYVVGEAVVEGSCCVPDGSWVYVTVPGYVVGWQKVKNESGLPVSEVEPVRGKEEQSDIRRTIETNEGASLVGFW